MPHLNCVILSCEEKFEYDEHLSDALEARWGHMMEKHESSIYTGPKLPYEPPVITFNQKNDESRPEMVIVWLFIVFGVYAILGVLIWQAVRG